MKRIVLVFALLIPSLGFAGGGYYDINLKATLKHPIVLVHGATLGGARLRIGPLDLGEYFSGVPKYLSRTGTKIYVVELPTDATISERAFALKQYLETDLKGEPVNIVAHSLGGLDARYLVSVLKYDKIKSITTIATPHRGSPLADWAVAQMSSGGIWYQLFKIFGYNFSGRRFLPQLTTDYMQNAFNPKVPDAPSVRYYSVVAWINDRTGTPAVPIFFPRFFLKRQKHAMALEPNDGLVPKSSQPWGLVIHETEIDHMAQINHHFLRYPPAEQKSLTVYFEIYQKLLDEGL